MQLFHVATPTEGKGILGRPTRRWEVNIKLISER